MASVRVLRPGLLTTVQDRGRWGLQARGVPPAGPMDPWSHRLANALVGNGAGRGDARDHAGRSRARIRGRTIRGRRRRRSSRSRSTASGQSPNTAFTVPSGARLRFGGRRAGRAGLSRRCWGVRRARGARQPFDAPRRAGWAESEAVRWRRAIRCRSDRSGEPHDRGSTLMRSRRLRVDEAARIRVLPGPHADRFSADALDRAPIVADYTVDERIGSDGIPADGPSPHTHAAAPTSSRTRRRSACCRCRRPVSRSC